MNHGSGSDLNVSGERWVVDRVLRPLAQPGRDLVVFDVGANNGAYTQMVREALGPQAWIFCFEPSPANLAWLRPKVAGDDRIRVVPVGLSDQTGLATLYGAEPGTVVGTLHPGLSIRHEAVEAVEECLLSTLDAECDRLGIDQVDLLKLDIEGHELPALLGARSMLARGAIRVIQFEFGVAQINAHSHFRDLWQLLDPAYRIYRVLRSGFYPIDQYDEVREIFRTSNYLAIQRTGEEG